MLVSPLRLAALLPAAAGVWLAATPKRFDVYVDRSGAGAAIRGARGELVTTGRRRPSSSSNGSGPTATRASPTMPALRRAGAATRSAASSTLGDGRAVALVKDRRAFEEDCRRAVVVISPLAAPPACKPAVLLDRTFLAAHGAAAIRFTPTGPEVVTTRQPGESRPWPERAGPPAVRRSTVPAHAGPSPDAAAPPPDASRPSRGTVDQ